MADSVEVERDLEVLLKDEEVFEPPQDFVEQANFSDASIYDEAENDFEAWWERWAKELDWFEPWQTVLEWNPPWAKWF
jgi:acetyl-CoA synthetase